jgi:hypothetical protein
MPKIATRSDPVSLIMAAIRQQPGGEITRSRLRDITWLNDNELLPVLRDLKNRGWLAHTEYPGSRSGDVWKMTPLGQQMVGKSKAFATPALITMPDGTLIMRPNRRQLGDWYLGSIIAGLALLLPMILRGLLEMSWLGAGLVVLGAIVLGFTSYFVRAWMETTRLTPAALITRTWYGKTRTTARESIARVALVRSHAPMARVSLDYMLFLDVQGHCLARVATEGIPDAEQISLAEQLGVPFANLHQKTMTPGQIRAQFPGSVSWVEAHQILVGIVLALLITFAVIVIVLALAGMI